jgi:hypothetical protein
MKKLIVLAALLLFPSFAFGFGLTLSWDASLDTSVTGYKIYYGTAYDVLDQVQDVGDVSTYTFTNLAAGYWFFRVKAYNATGQESNFSGGAFGEAKILPAEGVRISE